MDPLDEFNKIYEELREISLKDNQVNLMTGEIQFDDISDINHYEEFFDDKGFQEDLLNFYLLIIG